MKKVMNGVEVAAGLGLLAVGFLQACSLTFGRPIISFVLWPMLALAAAVLLYRVIRFRHYTRTRLLWLMLAFCLSGLISTALNLRYGWYNNVRTIVLQAIFFFVVYAYDDEETMAAREEKTRIYAAFYLAACFLMSAVSFGYMIAGEGQIFRPETGPVYYTGFFWGRLFGIYWDPNIGALMCCVSAVLALGWFFRTRSRWSRIVMVAVILMDVAYIAFSDSRTGRVCLAAGAAAFTLLYLAGRKKAGTILLGVILALGGSIALPQAVQSGYNAVRTAETVQSTPEPESTPDPETTPEPEATPKATIGREEDYHTDISNRRFAIWGSALEIFRLRPVFGIGHNNVLAFADRELPETYLVNNDHMRFDSMHNTFFDVLVGQGAVGLLIYLAMGVTAAVCFIRNGRRIRERTDPLGASGLTVVIMVIAAGCFISEIVYVVSPMAFMFWRSAGTIMMAATRENVD